MFKGSYHPKAFLLHKKNVKRGLTTRTKIIFLLEESSLTAKMLSEGTGVIYPTVLHHLRLMEDESMVVRRGRRPFLWELTGAGQRRLVET